MKGKPPANADEDGIRSGRNGNYLAINHLHLHGNDLAELRRIAEINPDLANKIVDQRDSEDLREHASLRFGIVSAVILATAILASLSVLLIWVGIIGTFCSILGILATALLVRVILTGEWSETSWFGKGVDALVGLLGGKPSKDDDNDG